MCGIFGANYKTKEDVLKASTSLNYRGPDSHGFSNFGDFNLAHNRLAIQDLSSKSNQPFSYKDSIILYNGELWANQTLPFFNQKFETIGDVEKLIKLIYEQGISKISDVSGMFGFAFLKDKKLILCTVLLLF